MALNATLPNYLAPSTGKGLYAGNYIDFADSSFQQWGQQFLPDLYEKEAEIYGNRTIGGFLKMVSAEMPSQSDQIIWTEQGRLHSRFTGLYLSASNASSTDIGDLAAISASTAITSSNNAAGRFLTFKVPATATEATYQGTPTDAINSQTTNADRINFRVGQTVMVGNETTSGKDVIKGVVTKVADYGFEIAIYQEAPTSSTSDTFTALAYGNEFAKGTGNFEDKLDPGYTTYDNSPIIMKEHYKINGSDTSQIGWIEVTSENGANGYLWYVKSEHENRLRWEDQIEMTMLEAVPVASTAVGANKLSTYKGDFGGVGALSADAKGTQGLFDALEERGNIYNDLTDDIAVGGRNGLAAFDNILKQLDKQGAIEENMLYVNRDLALEFDNLLASQSDYTQNGGGASWGVFNNSQSMALNLGFTGFRRGSYDFYKTDWKYLNDYSTRGGFNDIEGVMIPAGTSTVYDQVLGKNIKRPFLHVRYRASETDNRKMKSWITGSVGGAYTTDVDELRMHYLTERCLITQGANNFFLLKG